MDVGTAKPADRSIGHAACQANHVVGYAVALALLGVAAFVVILPRVIISQEKPKLLVESIALKRLEARPIATLSVEAQERHEKREKVYRDE